MMSLEQQINAVENTILDYELRITNCEDQEVKKLLLLNLRHLRKEKEQLREEKLLLLRAQETTGKRIVPVAHIQ